jgi:hypothetical protein
MDSRDDISDALVVAAIEGVIALDDHGDGITNQSRCLAVLGCGLEFEIDVLSEVNRVGD